MIFSVSMYAEGFMKGVMINIKSSITDLRSGGVLNKRDGNISTGDIDSLKIGSIFIDSDGTAKKVVSITEENGDTVIKTRKPAMEEVMDGLYIPNQDIKIGYENIIPGSIAEGVKITPGGAMKGSRGYMEDADYVVSISIPLSKLINTKYVPLEEDDWERFDIDMFQNTVDEIKKMTASGSIAEEIQIVGSVKMKDLGISVGASMPYIRTEWVRKWWGGYPRFTQQSGYVGYQYRYKIEKSIAIEGGAKIQGEKKYLLYGVDIPGGPLAKAELGLFLTVKADGMIIIGWETYDYTDGTNGASAEIVFSSTLFSLRNVSKVSRINERRQGVNMAAAGSVSISAGPSLEFGLEALGFNLAEAAIETGVTLEANVCMEKMGINYINGVKQPFTPPVFQGSLTGYAYFDITASLLDGRADFDIYNKKETIFSYYKKIE